MATRGGSPLRLGTRTRSALHVSFTHAGQGGGAHPAGATRLGAPVGRERSWALVERLGGAALIESVRR